MNGFIGWCSSCGVVYDTPDAFALHEPHAHYVPPPWCEYHQSTVCLCPYMSSSHQFERYRLVHPRDFFG